MVCDEIQACIADLVTTAQEDDGVQNKDGKDDGEDF